MELIMQISRMLLPTLSGVLILLFTGINTNAQSVKEILNDYVADFNRNHSLNIDVTFGIEVDGKKQSISVERGKASLTASNPEKEEFCLIMSRETLLKIYTGELNIFTAAGREKMSDPAPVNFRFSKNVSNIYALLTEKLYPVGFHFFTKGFPEIIRTGKEYSRLVHGGNAVLIYYAKGLRTGWYHLEKGMIINEDWEHSANPFNTLVLVTEGSGTAQLNDTTVPLNKGTNLFIPKGVKHQFKTTNENGLEFYIIMFGEGA